MSQESALLSPDLSPTPSPYITAPSSPKPSSEFSDGANFPEFHDLDEIEYREPSCSSISFIDWGNDHHKHSKFQPPEQQQEEEFTTDNDSTYYAADHSDDDVTFEFCVNRLETCFSSLPAEELFDGGKIKPLRPPPISHQEAKYTTFIQRRRFIPPPAPNSSPAATSSVMNKSSTPRWRDSVDLDYTLNHRSRKSKPQSCDFSRDVDPFGVTINNAKGDNKLRCVDTNKLATVSRGSSSSGCSLMSLKGWKRRFRNLFTQGNNNETNAGAAKSTATTTSTRSSIGSKTTSFGSSRSGSGSGSSSSSASSFRERCIYDGSSYYPNNNYYGMRAAEEGFGGNKTFMPYKQGLLNCFVKRV